MDLQVRNAQDNLMLTTGLYVTNVTGDSIDFGFDSMPGNQPGDNANTVFLWQTSSHQIPTPTKPKFSQKVTVSQPNGTGTFDGLTVTTESYLLGYAVGSDVKNVCATVFIPAQGGGPTVPFQPKLSASAGSTSVRFEFTLPGGTYPTTDGDWAGLWIGQGESALYSLPPDHFVQITENTSSGGGSFNDVPLRRGSQFTIGYFKGGYQQDAPKQSTLACSVTFSV